MQITKGSPRATGLAADSTNQQLIMDQGRAMGGKAEAAPPRTAGLPMAPRMRQRNPVVVEGRQKWAGIAELTLSEGQAAV